MVIQTEVQSYTLSSKKKKIIKNNGKRRKAVTSMDEDRNSGKYIRTLKKTNKLLEERRNNLNEILKELIQVSVKELKNTVNRTQLQN